MGAVRLIEDVRPSRGGEPSNALPDGRLEAAGAIGVGDADRHRLRSVTGTAGLIVGSSSTKRELGCDAVDDHRVDEHALSVEDDVVAWTKDEHRDHDVCLDDARAGSYRMRTS